MKLVATLTFALAVTGAAFTSTSVQAANVDSLNGICENVAADNKSRFRKKLKESGLKLRDVYDAISCGGDNLVRFAMSKSANSVGSYIVKRLPASHFAASGDTEWAANKGLSGSPIVATIAAR